MHQMIRYAAATLTLLAFGLALPGGAEAGGGGCHSQAVTNAEGVAVELKGLCFEPTVIHIRAGQRVTWTNRDAVPHTVTGANATWGNTAQLGLGETATVRFDTPGTQPYFCALHPSMVGAVVVGGDAAPASASAGAGAGAGAQHPALIAAASVRPSNAATAADSSGGRGVPPWMLVPAAIAGLALGAGATTTGVRRLVRRHRE